MHDCPGGLENVLTGLEMEKGLMLIVRRSAEYDRVVPLPDFILRDSRTIRKIIFGPWGVVTCVLCFVYCLCTKVASVGSFRIFLQLGLKKKLTFIADMSANAFRPPPPLGFNEHISKN